MSKTVNVHKGIGAIAGLNWSVLSGKASSANIRRNASLIRALRYSVRTIDGANYLGLETLDVLAKLKCKKRHSLAFLCLNYLSGIDLTEHPAQVEFEGEDSATKVNAVFVLSVKDEADKRAVVVIRNGLIELDTVEGHSKAIALAQDKRTSLNDHCAIFCELDEIDRAMEVTWQDLFANANSKSLLRGVPTNPLTVLAVLGVVLAGGLGAAYYTLVIIPEQEAERLRRLAQADRTPHYMAELQSKLAVSSWDHEALKASIERTSLTPYLLDGWAIQSVSCNLSECTETWSRVSGDLKTLMRARPGARYLPEASKATNTAVFAYPVIAPATQGIDPESIPVGALEKHAMLRPTIQKLENAGYKLSQGNELVFPPMPISGIDRGSLVTRSPIDIAVALNHANEVIDMLPMPIGLDGYTIRVANKQIYIELEGFAYAK